MSPIEGSVEVRVPARAAYEQWTRFEEYPRFMEGVEEVRRVDDTHLHWVATVADERLEWDSEVVEREPGRRLAWRATDGDRDLGEVVLTPGGQETTRVALTVDRGAGASEEGLREDLERFKALVESGAEAPAAAREGRGGARLPRLSLLRGMDVCDPADRRVGRVKDVVLDRHARYVRLFSVRVGRLSRTGHVVPVDDVTFVDEGGDAYLRVPYTAEEIKHAPSLDRDDELTPARERAITSYYRTSRVWEEARDAVRARQTPPAPTRRIAEAEVADAISRGDDPSSVRVKRWGV
jgi:sporulation protein YlmC with PRC-barrel domain